MLGPLLHDSIAIPRRKSAHRCGKAHLEVKSVKNLWVEATFDVSDFDLLTGRWISRKVSQLVSSLGNQSIT